MKQSNQNIETTKTAGKDKQETKLSRLLNGGKIPTPKQIMEYLNERVIGQEEAKKRISVAVYNHYKRMASNMCGLGNDGEFADVTIDKSNIIMLGGTGTGKTFIVQNIAKMLGVPCHIHDCTKLTESGYVGEDVENILTGLLQNADYDVKRAEVGIVCLDEFDKLAKKGSSMSLTRDVSGEGVQQGLLKIVEGSVVGVMPQGGRKHPEQPLTPVDTTNILFIGMGAFCGMEDIIKRRISKNSRIGFSRHDDNVCDYEPEDILDEATPTDLKTFGLIPELIGRFPVITHTNQLKKDDLIKIIKEPKNSIMKQYQKLAHIDGKTLTFTDEAIETIAEASILSETGARGLRATIETILNDFMFEAAESKTKNLVVDCDYVKKSLKSVFGRCGNKEEKKKAA